MNDSTALRCELACPAAALEVAFRGIAQQRMADVPILNPALRVEAVGFRPWAQHWLGVLVTPWFMNLWLMPRQAEAWSPLAVGKTRHHVFPAGVFEFIGGLEASIGDYQACSLFSPMFEFSDHAAARDTAAAALLALFDVTHREAGQTLAEVPAKPALARATGAVSKREFLLGRQHRPDRGS